MIQWGYASDHPERTRMAHIVSSYNLGHSLHRNQSWIEEHANRDAVAVSCLLIFLEKIKCIRITDDLNSQYERWCRKTEVTWWDEWLKWNDNVNNVSK